MGHDKRVHIAPSDAADLRRAALAALAADPDHLTIDLRDLQGDAEAVSNLRVVQDAARGQHCALTVQLTGLTVEIVE